MKPRDLKLNSLSRYSKMSPQFILEEHGHCEVPAGCGGVVLRWFNPKQGRPIQFWLETNGDASVFLDGTSPNSGRPLVSYGNHVLSLDVVNPDRDHGVMMFVGEGNVKSPRYGSETSDSAPRILSSGDGTWRCSTRKPESNAWMLPGFDDSGWTAMTECEFTKVKNPNVSKYRIEQMTKMGAKGLTVPWSRAWWRFWPGRPTPPPNCVWIRKTFRLSLDTSQTALDAR
jgi:hypothetical protein